ncbi:DNA helicase MCM8-like [Lineus longissimus]|uniref:DNA helicase MCM8-like n=1 Tax=Lineus longissimus TaxID=88925 RepID=UPI002B4E36E8
MSQQSGGGHGNSQWRGRGFGWRGRGKYFNTYGRGRGRGGQQSNNRDKSQSRASQSSQTQPDRPRYVQTQLDNLTPYKGWKIYFPDDVYSEFSPTVQKIQLFEKFFVSWKLTYKFAKLEADGFFMIDFKELEANEVVKEGYPVFLEELRSNPEMVINTLGLAMHQIMCQEQDQVSNNNNTQGPSIPYSLPKIHARIINYDGIIHLKNLKANYYGKFLSVKGTVVRVGNIKPICTRMAFECGTCSGIQAINLPDGKYILPTKCPAPDCRGRTFYPKRESSLTETVDWQSIRVQEIMTDDHRESGRIPRTVDCELTADLVDSCVPGDMVTVSGVVKVTSTDSGYSKNNKDKCMFLLYIHANSVNNAKGNKVTGDQGAGVAMEFSVKELYAIEEIQEEQNLFRLIVGSLCPSIYGHETVKAGLVLGLFGGSQKYGNDKNHIPVRGDPHILVVGDPGLGKSQMLQAVAGVAPRSVYVCGNTTTTAGLTVTLSKEGGSGDYALEAGALVLADQGCCCIDEFDKMGNQHQALLEAMEQQSISIAKAGIVCSLPARASIIAAANPVGGHYNKAKTVSENLKMGSALLSRFDLVFIMLDRPDEEMDSMLSEHVMSLHAGQKKTKAAIGTKRKSMDDMMDESRRQWEADKPLSERLKTPRDESFDPLPAQLLRKYIGYARKYVHPSIGADAAALLQKFYLDLRKNHHSKDSTPITTRQLESLIRLTEARARLELREAATAQDAQDVIDIMKDSMMDTFSNEFGFLDFQRSQHGSGMSSKSQAKKFVSVLQKIAEQTYNSLFAVQQMRQIAQDAGIQVKDFEGFVSSLNNQGFLLQKGPRVYQLQTTGF